MNIIENYTESKPKLNLLYLAKPIYGGWVTFTAHMSKKYDYPIYKITKNSEKTQRDFGYDCKYQNLKLLDALKLQNIFITAVDKHYWDYLRYFPKDTKIVIHDPTECKRTKSGNPLVQEVDGIKPLLCDFKIYTIRESVQKYLVENFNFESIFMKHPFYEYSKTTDKGLKYNCVSVARIDFDKNTDIILKYNNLMVDSNKRVKIFGAENRIYVHHKLKDLNFHEYWYGKYPKELPMNYKGKDILLGCKFMIDLSVIKNDGGGTQYTFLEAIYMNCALILSNKWTDGVKTPFKHGVNCFIVKNEDELAEILNKNPDTKHIVKNAKKMLKNHIKAYGW